MQQPTTLLNYRDIIDTGTCTSKEASWKLEVCCTCELNSPVNVSATTATRRTWQPDGARVFRLDHHVPLEPMILDAVLLVAADVTAPEAHATVAARRADEVGREAGRVDGRRAEMTGRHR